MTRRPLLIGAAGVATALVALAACSDKPAQPTAPRAPAPVAAAVVPGGTAPAGASTVCLAYLAKQSVAQEKLTVAEERSASAEIVAPLRARVEKLDAIVADACN